MGSFDSFNNFMNGPASDQTDQALSSGSRYNYLGANPYQGGWDALIGQLRMQANGSGPSLAQEQYKQANQDAMGNQLAMSQGNRSPGAGYQASQNIGRIGQGLAQGSAEARLKEQMMAQQQLAGALGTAGQQDFQRQYANQQAYLGILGQQAQQPSMFDQMAGIAAQGLGAYALFNPPGKGGGGTVAGGLSGGMGGGFGSAGAAVGGGNGWNTSGGGNGWGI